VEHPPGGLVAVARQPVQRLVELPQRRAGQVDRLLHPRSQKYAVAGSGSHTRAAAIPGRSTSARYSVPNATSRSVSAMTAGLQAIGSRSTPKPDSVPTTKV